MHRQEELSIFLCFYTVSLLLYFLCVRADHHRADSVRTALGSWLPGREYHTFTVCVCCDGLHRSFGIISRVFVGEKHDHQ